MKIKHVSCTQFAGIRDRDVSFTDGINVIYGKNESGKSTLVNLISRTLFQHARLNRRTDKEFIDLYFPAAKKGRAVTGDFADGKITLETENGTYTLSKEWGDDARCTLSTPDGVVRDVLKIDEAMREVLCYGEGVYADLLLSSQRNTDAALQSMLDATKKTDAKQEIVSAVSQAFAESDGIAADTIEQAILQKIDEIAGKHWDFERDAPVRKAGRWGNGLGEILRTYYAMEDAREALDEISRLEQAADRASTVYAERDAAARAAEEAYDQFHTFAGRLAVQSERKKAIDRLENERIKIADVLAKWPALLDQLEKAKALQTEKHDRLVTDVWNFVQATAAELSDDDRAAAALPYPTATELSEAKKHYREIARLEAQLCNMNVNAAAHLFGGHEMHIVSLRTGETIDITDGTASITEAVKITVPGVMELQLSPADVDVTAVEADLALRKDELSSLLAGYAVDSVEALELYAQTIDAAKAKAAAVQTKIDRALGSLTMAELEAMYTAVGTVTRTKDEIENELFAVCGSADATTFITKAETVLDGYAAEYGGVNDLKVQAFDLDAELQKAKASVSSVEDIPAAYRAIADPDAHLEALQAALKDKQSLREVALTEKTASASRLDTFKDAHPEACRESLETAERRFEETKSLLHHWMHIAEVFQAQKDGIDNHPLQDIATNFARYLALISDGKISSEFPEVDKLSLNVYSDDRTMDYGKLSEGTKETVSLAFRLAVLDHLFPEGGGILVLDDPFTDMDAERTAQSCALIKECATRHQVIFLTCREDYLPALQGSQILF